MTEDVERAAMAIAVAEFPDVVVDGEWADGVPPAYIEKCRRFARAAISALREPSEAMKARHGGITLICFQDVLDAVLGEPVDA